MTKFLKLVGADTFSSRSTGTVRRGQTLRVEDEDRAEELLEKGEYAEDGHFRPMFQEETGSKAKRASAPTLPDNDAPSSTSTHVAGTGDIRSGAFGGPAPQAPMGEGPNGAENDIDLHEVDSEMDGVKDVAYHGGPNDNEPDSETDEQEESVVEEEEAGEESQDETQDDAEEESAKPAAKKTRQRKPKA